MICNAREIVTSLMSGAKKIPVSSRVLQALVGWTEDIVGSSDGIALQIPLLFRVDLKVCVGLVGNW